MGRGVENLGHVLVTVGVEVRATIIGLRLERELLESIRGPDWV